MGATVVGPRLSAATFDTAQAHGFTAAEVTLLDEIGEVIIPATDVPGAKAVGIGFRHIRRLVQLMVLIPSTARHSAGPIRCLWATRTEWRAASISRRQ